MVDHEASWINSCQNCLPVDEHLNSWLLRTEESECDLVQAWCYRQNYTLVLIPKEVLRARVNTLELPRNRVAVSRELAWSPDPSGWAVLLTDNFIKLLLGREGCLQVVSIDLLFDLLMHFLESLVDVFDIYKRLIGQTNIFEIHLLDFMSRRAHTSLMLDFLVSVSFNALISRTCSLSKSSNLYRSHFMSI